ncbi:MAG: glycosyl hydrolase [Gemmatimonadetes bacterium]|nr:glycosyl hydrolase [Gemmatimonadota bacterium]
MRWRLVGPFRGGRAVAVTGDPTDARVFWFGAVNGGVWKTANGGQTWRNMTDGKSDISSVGAVALAPSDHNVIYVGTGEAQLREDLTYGTGMYRSTDGGQHWQHLGLDDTQQIAQVVVDPRDPDKVYVAAMGHAFGPNAERGVFRSADGGKSWKKVLFLNDSTGAIDLAMEPGNPRILYAAMWKFQRTPWGMNAGGGRSGLWKSTDGGDTWQELSFNAGIPRTPLGKIGVAVSPANPQRVWASIEAPDSSGGIFRSDDAGATWTRTSGDQKFAVRAFYYSSLTADPVDENTVYVMNLSVWRSIDGGHAWSSLPVPHGDTHTMWIDPKDPKRMINSNDGGATVSYDGGATWSTQQNQPTAQFYHVTTDQQFPYRLYGAQQDNSTVSIASRSDDGRIGLRDFFPVAGCENATIAVDPRDPNVTYGGCYTGMFTRNDRRTRQERDISTWLYNYDGWAAGDVPFRFQWTFPVLLSPHDPNTLYVASQYVHRSTNEGQSWERISPDLTVHDKATLVRSGGPIHGDMTGTEWYATIYALAESPRTKGVLWAGSDDGLVHVSKDGGAHWDDVTPKGYGTFTRTAGIEASPHDAGTAYVAANRYQQDDFKPYFWKTTDYGRSWTAIAAGLPVGAYARTIREDPVRRGLLYAGTEIGVYVSLDDGAHWEPLQLNLPRSSVRDLTIHGNDLIAATHGRAFWSLDDVSSLREMADSVTAKRAHLFQPAPAVRWFGGGGRSLTEGENPAGGAVIDYWLRERPKDGVKLQFLDGAGAVIRTYESGAAPSDSGLAGADSAARAAAAAARDSLAYDAADSLVAARPGADRFVWNLRYPGAKSMKNTVLDEGTLDGPVAPPGNYAVRLIAGADTLTRRFTVVKDPRVKTPDADLVAQFRAALRVRDRISELVESATRIEDVQAQVDQRTAQSKEQPFAKRVADAATPLRQKFEGLRTELYEVGCHVDECTLDQPIKLYNMLLSLNAQIQTGDYGPTKQHGEVADDLSGKLNVVLQRLQQLEDGDLAAFNKMLQELGLPAVYVPPRKTIS